MSCPVGLVRGLVYRAGTTVSQKLVSLPAEEQTKEGAAVYPLRKVIQKWQSQSGSLLANKMLWDYFALCAL